MIRAWGVRRIKGFTPLEKQRQVLGVLLGLLGGRKSLIPKMTTRRRSLTGFTLVEIMVVIAVIIVIASIGVPGIMRQRVNANEAAAVAALKTLSAASVTYRATHSSYPGSLTDLYDPEEAQYIDSTLASGTRQGYNFTLSGDEDGFNATAIPAKPNITGTRYFMIDFYGVIRSSNSGPADENSPAI